MRAAAIAAAVFAAFVGVMYLRFSGDAVPEPSPKPSPGANVAGNCIIARLVGAPEATPAPSDAPPTRVPCATVNASDPNNPPVLPQPPPPTPVPPPTVLGGIDVIPLHLGPEIELPRDIALTIPPRCGNCPGPAGGYSRVYQNAAGQLRTDTLLTLESLGLSSTSASGTYGAYFTGFAADNDGSPMAVSVCKTGPCFSEPGRPSPAGADSAIFLSVDGGISWSELDAPDGMLWVAGVMADGRVLVVEPNDKPEPPLYRILPGGDVLMRPSAEYAAPVPLANGDIVWPTETEGILRSDGSSWLGAWADPRKLQFTWEFVFDPSHERVVASAMTIAERGVGSAMLVVFSSDGSLQRAYSHSGYIFPSAWLDDRRVLAIANPCDVGYSFCPGARPAIIDVEAGLLHFIHPPFDPPIDIINDIPAVQQGPFARVVDTDNTCLNVRAEPAAGQILDCAAEGVLLRDLGQAADVAGVGWLRIATPAGVEGWASTQYLER